MKRTVWYDRKHDRLFLMFIRSTYRYNHANFIYVGLFDEA